MTKIFIQIRTSILVNIKSINKNSRNLNKNFYNASSDYGHRKLRTDVNREAGGFSVE